MRYEKIWIDNRALSPYRQDLFISDIIDQMLEITTDKAGEIHVCFCKMSEDGSFCLIPDYIILFNHGKLIDFDDEELSYLKKCKVFLVKRSIDKDNVYFCIIAEEYKDEIK